MSSLQQQIKSIIKEAGEAKEISELSLQDVKFGKFDDASTKLLESCTQLNFLSLAGCGLTTLKGMPKLKLQGLDLSNNNISDEELKHLRQFGELVQLSLHNNQIKSLENIKACLSGCKNMEELDISENPVEKDPNFSKVLFETFSKLEILNGKDKNGKQVQEEPQEQDSGQYEDQENLSDQEEEDDYDEEESESPQPKKKKK